jgi:hypothetical protein
VADVFFGAGHGLGWFGSSLADGLNMANPLDFVNAFF